MYLTLFSETLRYPWGGLSKSQGRRDNSGKVDIMREAGDPENLIRNRAPSFLSMSLRLMRYLHMKRETMQEEEANGEVPIFG